MTRPPTGPSRAELALLRRIAAGGRLVAVAGGHAEAGREGRVALSAERARAFVSDGLLRPSGDALVATPEAAAALRRIDATEVPFQAQHQTRSTDTATGAAINRDESPLDRLARGRKGEAPFLSPALVTAAERLREDFERGLLQPRVTASWDRPIAGGARAPRGGREDVPQSAMLARRRFRTAMETVGPELAGIVTDVVCALKGLETVERERGWPARSAKLVLRLGLAALARHYGLADQATGPARAPMRATATPDARPLLRPPAPDAESGKGGQAEEGSGEER